MAATELEHAAMVFVLAKNGQVILSQLTPHMVHLWHMATGVSGEAGELIDAIKKYAVYNKDIDRANILEELGDLEFYMQGIREALKISREECLRANMAKLAKRYPGYKYSDRHAHERADKSGPGHPGPAL